MTLADGIAVESQLAGAFSELIEGGAVFVGMACGSVCGNVGGNAVAFAFQLLLLALS